MLELRQVSVRFDSGFEALQNVDLSIPRGQFCVLLGPSGAGKSTLLRVINGLRRPTFGCVFIDGKERSAQHRSNARVATIHQSIELTARLTVLQNVLCGALAEIGTVRALLGLFGLERTRRACRLLHQVGLGQEHLYRRAADLSGGQQQRVGVARAFMGDPALVLADEPVASLDPRTGRDILKLLHEAARARNAAVVCSLHQVELAAEFADRIVGMRAGRIAFDCAPSVLNANALTALYAAAA